MSEDRRLGEFPPRGIPDNQLAALRELRAALEELRRTGFHLPQEAAKKIKVPPPKLDRESVGGKVMDAVKALARAGYPVPRTWRDTKPVRDYDSEEEGRGRDVSGTTWLLNEVEDALWVAENSPAPRGDFTARLKEDRKAWDAPRLALVALRAAGALAEIRLQLASFAEKLENADAWANGATPEWELNEATFDLAVTNLGVLGMTADATWLSEEFHNTVGKGLLQILTWRSEVPSVELVSSHGPVPEVPEDFRKGPHSSLAVVSLSATLRQMDQEMQRICKAVSSYNEALGLKLPGKTQAPVLTEGRDMAEGVSAALRSVERIINEAEPCLADWRMAADMDIPEVRRGDLGDTLIGLNADHFRQLCSTRPEPESFEADGKRWVNITPYLDYLEQRLQSYVQAVRSGGFPTFAMSREEAQEYEVLRKPMEQEPDAFGLVRAYHIPGMKESLGEVSTKWIAAVRGQLEGLRETCLSLLLAAAPEGQAPGPSAHEAPSTSLPSAEGGNPMPDMIRQYTVFIGHPSDVGKEYDIAKEVIESLNDTECARRKCRFNLISGADAPSGVGRPQGIVNQLLPRAHLFIALFWEILGSPTGKAESGTVEEWNEALQAHKRQGVPSVKLFFKKPRPVKLGDPGKKLKALLKFKESRKVRRGGLYKEFSTEKQFRNLLRKELVSWLDEQEQAPSRVTG